jgi:hypothetical protein
MDENNNKRVLIRIFPWVLMVVLISVTYFLLDNKMQKELESAKTSFKKGNVAEIISDLEMLELMHYKFKDVLFYKDLKGFLINDYDIPNTEPIAIVQGIAVGGIDFNLVEDIIKIGDSIVISIPKAKYINYELEDEFQIITKYDIDSMDIAQSLKVISQSNDSKIIQPLEIEISEEHILRILKPVLESMTKENLHIQFVDSK